MEARKILWKLILGILKLITKVFLVLLWGALRLAEVILSEINKRLKEIIH